ncbi:protoporphyrinogen oxidase [Leptospira perolatii]|uniref:Coproporphyrinogen III oxidase n=1 Tax=Leptospira perolatii TaxID=2023191 RepID=A0A2M9ZPQ1_9LEPT|nr:protoporphyrinogen oxidase [Leptospira perolatii]PJZ70743.1 protoporphyrinogen oxidase [Leptospira perolatii]PJZ73951.1 protoporphyrinogen oxidase [Leptospira perolatii]
MPTPHPDRIVIGAGFTGLLHAYLALSKGESVLVLEKADRGGGLIRSVPTEYGIVETAANGILNCRELELLSSKLGLDILVADPAAKRRFIFTRGKPRRIPLTFFEAVSLAYKAFTVPSKPLEGESVLHWGKRVLGESAAEKLLEPALGGIYAGDLDTMSAELVLGKFFQLNQPTWKNLKHYASENTSKPVKTRRGTVSFRGGIGSLVAALEARVKKEGKIKYEEEIGSLKQLRGKYPRAKITLATNLSSSLKLLRAEFSELKVYQGMLQTLPVVSVTRFGKDSILGTGKGFGILFPKDHKTYSSEMGIRVRGILFNNFIFPGRSVNGINSETYIYGGAGDREIATKSEAEIISIVEEDRKKIFPESSSPLNHYVTIWKDALPEYSPQLLSFNRDLDRILPEDLRVEGNFRYGIGLKSIIERAFAQHSL